MCVRIVFPQLLLDQIDHELFNIVAILCVNH